MINYISRKPKLMVFFVLLGIALTFTGPVMLQGIITTVHAFDCATSPTAPAIPSNQGYAVSWLVNEWLTYANVPIGPSRWTVSGKMKNGSGADDCFSEQWRLHTVVLQSSHDAERGKVIDLFNSSDKSQNSLDFYAAYNLQKNIPASGCAFGRCQTAAKTITYQPAFEAGSGTWNLIGLYGVLRNSKDNLLESHGYIPTQWEVSGQF